MKLRSLIFVCCLSLLSSAFADNRHMHPKANENKTASAKKAEMRPGYCEVEVINQSGTDIRVSGYFDDGTALAPFNVYSYEAPHYISLYYYGYCHAGMQVFVDAWEWPLWRRVYSDYTPVGYSVYYGPYYKNQVKITVRKK